MKHLSNIQCDSNTNNRTMKKSQKIKKIVSKKEKKPEVK